MLIEKENELNKIRKENQGLREEIKSMLDPIGGGSLLREVSFTKVTKLEEIQGEHALEGPTHCRSRVRAP